jgi:hypothetical protein
MMSLSQDFTQDILCVVFDSAVDFLTSGCLASLNRAFSISIREWRASLESMELDEADRQSLHAIAVHCHKLCTLRISPHDEINLDTQIQGICESNPTLQRVELNHTCACVTDVAIIALARNCPGLRYLKVESQYITDESMLALTQSCRKLVHLELAASARITDATVGYLENTCTSLEHLSLENCHGVSDSALKKVLTKCLGLRELSLANTVQEDGISLHPDAGEDLRRASESITDATVAALVQTSPRMTYLNLTGRVGISGNGIVYVVQHLRHLQHLVLRAFGARLGDNVLRRAFADPRPALTNLDLTRCGEVSHEAIKVMVSSCANLKDLSLAHCSSLDDQAIAHVSEGLKHLQHLHLSGCNRISDKSVDMISSGCPHLQLLHIAMARNVSPSSLVKLQEERPEISVRHGQRFRQLLAQIRAKAAGTHEMRMES